MGTIIFNLLSRVIIKFLYWLGFEMYIKVKIEGDENLYKITKKGLIEEKKK